MWLYTYTAPDTDSTVQHLTTKTQKVHPGQYLLPKILPPVPVLENYSLDTVVTDNGQGTAVSSHCLGHKNRPNRTMTSEKQQDNL